MAKGAKRPQIEPARFTGQLAGVNTLLNAIREQIQIDQGDRGDPLDRAVKIRDLTDAGVAEFLLSKRGNGQYANIVSPSGKQLVTAAPPNPTNLQANPTTATVYLTWDAPNYPYHAYTEVWRSSEDNLSTAIDLGARPAYRYYADPVDSGRTYYYWIRFVTHAGKKSDYNAVDGVVATTNLPADVVLETLSGKITENELVKGLREQIGSIEDLDDEINKVRSDSAQALAAEANKRAQDILEETNARLLADSNEVQNRLAAIEAEKQARINAIQQEAKNRSDALIKESQDRVAEFQALHSIESAKNDARYINVMDRISTEEVTRIQQYQELTASHQTSVSSTKAQIVRLDEAVANEKEARASSINELSSEFKNELGDVKNAAVNEAINTITTDDNVIAQVISKISAADTTGWATTNYVDENAVTPLNSLSNRTATLENQYQQIGSEYLSKSGFTNWQKIYASDKSATTEQLNTIQSTIDNATTGLSSKASKTQLTQTKNDILNSSVSQFGQISAQFQNQQAAINSKATSKDIESAVASVEESSAERTTQTLNAISASSFEGIARDLRNIAQSASADKVVINRLDRMESEYKTGVSTTKAEITRTQETLTSDIEALARTVEKHNAEYNDDKVNVLASTTELNEVKTSAEKSAANQTSAVVNNIKVGDMESSVESIKSINQSSQAFKSVHTKIDTVKASLDQKTASIISSQRVIASDLETKATEIKQINTSVGNHSAMLQTQAESIDGLKTNWSIKFQVGTDGVKRISGFGLSADGETTGAHFDVDQFSISKPGAEALDFAVSDVLQPDGSTKRMVVMDAASLVNLVVTNAMIESISADKITAGKIDSLRIDTDTLTVRKVRSSNYIPQQTGIRLDDDGSFELNSKTNNGRILQNSDGIKVYDNNNVLRVKMGKL